MQLAWSLRRYVLNPVTQPSSRIQTHTKFDQVIHVRLTATVTGT